MGDRLELTETADAHPSATPAGGTPPSGVCPTTAEALLAHVWREASLNDTRLADNTAWVRAWCLVTGGSLEEAHRWFQQIGGTQDPGDVFWSRVGQQLRAMCAVLRQSPSLVGGPRSAAPPLAAEESAARLEPLAIRALGRLEIVRGERVLPPCHSRKALAILRYLLTRRHYCAPTSEIAELLWSELEPGKALHNVHVAISALRQHIDAPGGASYILAQSGVYLINPVAPITNQIEQFECAVQAATAALREGHLAAAVEGYAEALGRYDGDYYVDDHDTPWAVVERERLLSMYIDGLQHCGDAHAQLGQLEFAVGCYRALLARDPYREDVHEKLMRCYLGLGRRGDALHQYQQCAAVLAEGLGIAPGLGMRTLQASASSGAVE